MAGLAPLAIFTSAAAPLSEYDTGADGNEYSIVQGIGEVSAGFDDAFGALESQERDSELAENLNESEYGEYGDP